MRSSRRLMGSLVLLVLLCVLHALAVAQSVDPAALAELQQSRNVAPRVVERFAAGEVTVDVEFVLKGYDVNPPFYRPVVDDTPARRRWAHARLRAHMGPLLDPGLVSGNIDRGTLRLPATLPVARRLAASGFVHAIATLDGSYQQAASLAGLLGTVNVVPELSSQGLNGAGVRVAVIDNDFNASALGAAVVQEECFCRTNCCANGLTRQSGPGASNIATIVDTHGTEVASEIAFGQGAGGTAPAAGLVLLAARFPEDLPDALDWLATRPDVGVLNLSLLTATASGTCDADPNAGFWLPRIAALSAQDKVVVAASGNSGSRSTIGIPACLSQVTAVAGTWACTYDKPQEPPPEDGCDLGAEFDELWPTSATSLKVDALAPAKPLQIPYLPPGPTYIAGTSNAAPIVAGCAALLRQAFPSATAATIRAALRVSPTQVWIDDGNGKEFARGRLDCNAAFQSLQGTQGPPGINLNQHGLSGLWYDATTTGQGFSFEIFPNQFGAGLGNFTGGWFTFAPGAPGGPATQRWFSVGGQVSATEGTATLTIYRSVGGDFDAPPPVAPTAVGSATIHFENCQSGTFTYTFNPGIAEVGGASGSIALTRLLPNVACTPGGSPHPDFLMSGNWYEPATAGQGFILELNPAQPYLMALWYTYHPGGQGGGPSSQRWFSIQAPYAIGARSFTNVPIYETTGGVFTTPPPPGQPVTIAVGTASLTVSCAAASLSYAFTAGENAGRSGTINAVRPGPPPPGC